MVDPKIHKITRLFEELEHCKKNLRKLTSRKKRNVLLFLKKYFPFLGKSYGFDLQAVAAPIKYKGLQVIDSICSPLAGTCPRPDLSG
jgi:hypothetical protein